MNKLVSILTPCYNGEKTIDRLLDSVLAQTYRPLEMIVVDDGSKDSSLQHIEAYRELFKANSIQLVSRYQENQGLGGAINTALKLLHGEYFTLADADDFLAKDSITRRVQYLDEHPEISLVSSNAYVVSENDVLKPLRKCADMLPHIYEDNQFWHLLRGDSLFCPGCHMYRTADFEKVNPTRSIYPARRGQNWQLLLPMYYCFQRSFLDEPLYYYVVSSNSMSRDYSSEQKLYRCDEHENILRHALETIPLTPKDRLKTDEIICKCYARRRLRIYVKQGAKEEAKSQYAILRKMHCARLRDLYYRLCVSFPFLAKIRINRRSKR